MDSASHYTYCDTDGAYRGSQEWNLFWPVLLDIFGSGNPDTRHFERTSKIAIFRLGVESHLNRQQRSHIASISSWNAPAKFFLKLEKPEAFWFSELESGARYNIFDMGVEWKEKQEYVMHGYT